MAKIGSWNDWIRTHGPKLMLYSRQQTRSEADAEDVLQKAWILRKLLHEMDDVDAIEFLLDRLKNSKTNEDFFASMKRN